LHRRTFSMSAPHCLERYSESTVVAARLITFVIEP
jgi:hypothetical protein